ncbi:ATPase [Sphingomonas koreensis]|uniref:SRPBCC domain-containing protein n=1 Tax=Sphingomonas koreensis TaxID=93064 RepID=UPI0008334CBA|nr:SRPBCC domain-containing protein [Sphingomonas koreensis]PJI88269.1 uncharacterized protein YndB with AHSA1/START domain [Sphingomonas koreensis]RSU57648.1 ATPase [Sphingomonas koreensis]RSU65763.1 ATPase [Sphingomonas koreensis]
MTPPEHAKFIVERRLPGSPAHAFRFWAEPDLKRIWTGCHAEWEELENRFAFSPGAIESVRWQMPDGQEFAVRIHYFEILAAQRIVYAYDMALGGRCISVSLVTVEFVPADGETLMRFTEQAAFLDGSDSAARIAGTHEGFDRLVLLMAEAHNA